MATITITVSAGLDEFPPILSDTENHTADTAEGDKNFTTQLSPGDIVIWQKGNGVRSIDNVFENEGSIDLFSTDPALQTDGTWKGVVGTISEGTEEYSIQYTTDQGNQFTQDPKLAMRK